MEIIKKEQPKPDEQNDQYKDLFLPFTEIDVLSVFKSYINEKRNKKYLNGLTKYQMAISFCTQIDVYLESFIFYLMALYKNKYKTECPFKPKTNMMQKFIPITFFKFNKYWNAWLGIEMNEQKKICFKIQNYEKMLKEIYSRMNEKAFLWYDKGFEFIPIPINSYSHEWLTENEFQSLIDYVNPPKTAISKKEKYNPDW